MYYVDILVNGKVRNEYAVYGDIKAVYKEGFRLARLYKILLFDVRYKVYDDDGNCILWFYVRHYQNGRMVARLSRYCKYGAGVGGFDI